MLIISQFKTAVYNLAQVECIFLSSDDKMVKIRTVSGGGGHLAVYGSRDEATRALDQCAAKAREGVAVFEFPAPKNVKMSVEAGDVKMNGGFIRKERNQGR